MDLLNTIGLDEIQQSEGHPEIKEDLTYAKLDIRREEFNALVSKERALNEGRGGDTLLAVECAKEVAGEAGTRVCHR